MLKLFLIIFCTSIITIGHCQDQDSKKKPCDGAEYRQFDFWLGDWTVHQDTALAGTNSIVLLQNGCIVQENWVGKGGKYTGTSYNFYNPKTTLWQQLWIDNQGSNLQLKGELEENAMVLRSDTVMGKDSLQYLHKITWTPVATDHVNQHWQRWNSGDNTWKTLFNGDYRK